MSQIIAEPELFSLNFSLDDYIRNKRIYEYKVQSDSSVLTLFGDSPEITSYAAYKVKGIFQNSSDGPSVITVNPLNSDESKINLYGGDSFDLVQSNNGRLLKLLHDELLIFKLLYRDFRNSFENSGFTIRSNVAYDALTPLDVNVKSTNPFVSGIIQHISIYPGFYYRIRRLNNKLFLQITPKSVLEFNTDVYDLMKDSSFSTGSLEYLCQKVRLHNNRIAYLRSITNKQCDESIQDSPYNGTSYLNYINKISKHNLVHTDAKLLLVQHQKSFSSNYASCENAKPVIDFVSLSHLDSNLHSTINEKFKSQSADRRDLSLKYAKNIVLQFDGMESKIGPRKSCVGSYLEPPPFMGSFAVDKFFRFKDPVVNFRDVNGAIKHVSKDTRDLGAPQDLLKEKGYRPFLTPSEISISILAFSGLEVEAEKLKTALLNQDDPKFLNLQKMFGCTFSIGNIISIDPTQDIHDYPSLTSDCAIVVGKKDEVDSFGITSNAYVKAEVALLEQGIPVQYVVHGLVTSQYNHSIEGKVRDKNTLFGIGISILAKIGGNSMVLSDQTTKDFPSNNAVLGYNLARVFEPLNKSFKDSNITLNKTKTSIPLSASVSIMDQAGADILHQYPHAVLDENSLFSGESGQKLFERIPQSYTNIIIHKDGFFHTSELNDLTKLKRKNVGMFPVSIVTNNVPRISTSLQNHHYLPKAGMCIPLSDNEFLLSTTLISDSYNPISKGWPNPLLITIHKLENQNIPSGLKIRILHQIWAMTRSHPATQIPTRRPMSIHYSNKMAEFIRKVRDPEPGYFKKFAETKNRHGLHPKPFI